MRSFGIHTLAQSTEIERFSSPDSEQLGDREVAGLPGHRVVETMSPVSPAPVRLRRANPTSCGAQAQPITPPTAGFRVDIPSEEPAEVLVSEPSQVRYWRTPNRLMNQIWARKPDSAMPLAAAPDDAPDDLPEAENPPQGEVEIVVMAPEEDSAASLDVAPAAPTPFAFLSDHAFWEGLSGAVPDNVEAEPDEAYCGDAAAHLTSPVLAEPMFAQEDNRPTTHEPPAAPAPAPRLAPAPVARGSAVRASHASHVNLRGAARPQPETGQGLAISAIAQGVASDSASSGRGVVVTRKIRDDIAARAKLNSDSAGNVANIDRVDDFVLPPISFLTEPPQALEATIPTEFLQQNAGLLEGVLEDFNVRGEIVQACPGPVVTLYELEPAPGTKSSRVIALADDIARSMSAISARVAVVQGKNAIGIELPNAKRETVFLRELLASQDFDSTKHKLALCLGKTIGGEPVIVDLAKMPHLLVAGTTGSGKSVAINTMILSLLYRLKPEQCRLIMVDPKMLELSVYDGIPHLLTPVVTDPKKAVVALKWAVREMEERYKKMSKVAVRNIDGFNARVGEAKAAGEVITRTVQTGFDKHSGEAIYEEEVMDLEPLPYIVVIVDEMADLMMVAGKEIEGTIQRLAQMARAAGIHVVLATQRPSVDVITGTIKANFPTRISFQVTSKIDSRTILGEQGAEQLLGQGDMLYMAGGGRVTRVHGPFVSDNEVEKVVAHLKTQGRPQYLDAVTSEEEAAGEGEDGAVFDKSAMGQAESEDPYDQAVAVVLRDKKASTSYIQRRLQIGYNRAASIMERMENEGIVGPANHAGKREILVETGRAREDED